MSAARCAIVLTFSIYACFGDTAVVPKVSFRDDYTYSKELDAFYKEHKVAQRWSDALVICKAEGAELMIPSTSEEVDHVLKLSNSTNLWIAATDVYSEGDFLTVNGTPLSEMYMNWKNGEPNNVNNNENCIIMDRVGEYIDIPCDHFARFICKRSTANLTRNEPCQTYDLGYTLNEEMHECYKFHTLPLSWHQAFKTCKAEQSSLVIINSENEATYLTKLFAKYPQSDLKGSFDRNALHVGFSDLLTNGVYLTVEGQNLSDTGYENWSPSQPDNYQGKEHCGSMFRDGSLNDINCDTRAMFVCEKKISKNNEIPQMTSNN